MKVLGISAYYHDSAAVLIEDDIILNAAQEERFSRMKHDDKFPKESVRFCLTQAGLTLSDLDAIVFYDKPFLKFERLLETYYSSAPRGLFSFLKSMPVWLSEKLFLKKNIITNLEQLDLDFSTKVPILYSEHHLSHAASAYYASPFKEALVLTIDGVGEWATASIWHGNNGKLESLKEMHFPDSLGLFYSSFTQFLGFKVNSGEYKLMGLAPYGNALSQEVQHFENIIKEHLLELKEDGSLHLNQAYFKYMWGLKMIQEKKWEKLFGFSARGAKEKVEMHHSNLALAVQNITEEAVIKMAKYALSLKHTDNLCLAGGVALNCVANGKLIREKLFKNVFIQPASGDAGGALGAAWAYSYLKQNKDKEDTIEDHMKGAYLGPSFSKTEVERSLQKRAMVYFEVKDDKELIKLIVDKIESNQVVGFFRGRMEFGPRALGHRSIFANPKNPKTQSFLNLKIKNRESFRPFAPILLEEELEFYFENKVASPYMLLVDHLKEEHRFVGAEENFNMELIDRLASIRSEMPAITHLDYSARLQTVTENSETFLFNLLKEIKLRSGIGMLVNTSFNLRGEPIVCSPNDAIDCFLISEMDVLILENFVLLKSDQSITLVEETRRKYQFKED